MRAYLKFNGEEHLLTSIGWHEDKLIHVSYPDATGKTITVFNGFEEIMDELNYTNFSTNITWKEDSE